VKNHHYDGSQDKYQKKVIQKSTKKLNGAFRKLFNNTKDIFINHADRNQEKFVPANYQNVFRITINIGEQFEHYNLSDQVEGKGFINILNKETFEAIIMELDTINDLTDYLVKREQLLISGVHSKPDCREKDLLALFVTNAREFPVNVSEVGQNTITDCAGVWERYIESEAYQYKHYHDARSYFIG
jgi:hypothetical protein